MTRITAYFARGERRDDIAGCVAEVGLEVVWQSRPGHRREAREHDPCLCALPTDPGQSVGTAVEVDDEYRHHAQMTTSPGNFGATLSAPAHPIKEPQIPELPLLPNCQRRRDQ